jgi:heat shock protein HslJ
VGASTEGTTPDGRAVTVPPPDAPPPGPALVESTTWVLDAAASTGADGPLAEGVTLRFEAGEVAGNDGCNLVRGDYRLEGERLLFDRLAVTESACIEPPDVMARAERFTAALRAGTTLEVGTPTALVLVSADGARLVFGPEAAPPAAAADALVGTWRATLERTEGEGPEASVSASPVGTITFSADGTWSGRGPCGAWSGRWSAESAPRLAVTDAVRQPEGCDAGADALEAEALEVLAATTGFSRLGADAGFDLTGADPSVRILLSP